jgi:hypothetical protein
MNVYDLRHAFEPLYGHPVAAGRPMYCYSPRKYSNEPGHFLHRRRPSYRAATGVPQKAAVKAAGRHLGCGPRLNFEACGHAQSEKTQKFILRSPLRPNQLWFSHSLGQLQTSRPLPSTHVKGVGVRELPAEP